jgi:hypothetical protein
VSLRGAVVPHAAVLLPQLASLETRAASKAVHAALADLEWDGVDVVVIVSPHGSTSGVYAGAQTSLDDLGVSGIDVSWTPDEHTSAELARAWGRRQVNEAADHGIAVPVAAGCASGKLVVAAAIEDVVASDGSALERSLSASPALADALRALAENRSVGVVASAHTSAALSERAPLTERPDARATEERVLTGLRSDAGSLVDLARPLWVDGRACGVAVLSLFGRLFAGKPADVVLYDCPVGIGYMVATAAL